MVFRKLHFLIYTLLLVFLFVTQSCEKKTKDNHIKQRDTTEIDRLIDLAQNHYVNGKVDSSYYFYTKAKYVAETKKDTSKIIYSLSWMAQIQRSQGDYAGSETTSIEAFPFIENSNKFLYGETNIYIGLGNNYLMTLDNDNAIYYYKKAINSKTDEEIKSDIFNNIALAHTEKDDYEKAIQILLPLALKKELINTPATFARINDNLGYTYNKSGDSKAFFYLNKGLKIREQIKDNYGLIASYINLSEYYKTKNLSLSTKYAFLAYKKATKVKGIDDRLLSLKLLIQNSSGYELKKYSLAYLHINDSITKVRQKAKNQFAKIKYDSKQEKDENIKLKTQQLLQKEEQHNRNLLLYFVVGMIITMSIVVGKFLVAKNKREKIKSSYNTEIRIAKKLHDELANDVFHTMAFAETQDLSTDENREILISYLDTIYSRTRNISQENNSIEAGPLFLSNLKEMISAFNSPAINVLINGIETIDWSPINGNSKIIIYRVLQELLVNMKKHSQCSLAVLTFKKIGTKLQIDYTDNGLGIGNKQLNSKNGLLNVENRILAVKGNITFDTKSEKGFRVQFNVPI